MRRAKRAAYRNQLIKTASTTPLADGTRFDGQGSYTLNGQTREYTDAWLADTPFFREFTTKIPLSPAAQNLPELRGAGLVRDLREAANLPRLVQVA